MLIFYWCTAALRLSMKRREKSLKMIFRESVLSWWHKINIVERPGPAQCPSGEWKWWERKNLLGFCEAVSRVSCWIMLLSIKVSCLVYFSAILLLAVPHYFFLLLFILVFVGFTMIQTRVHTHTHTHTHKHRILEAPEEQSIIIEQKKTNSWRIRNHHRALS